MGALCTHLSYAWSMSKVIQVRGVPDEVHEILRNAADAQGLSLSKYMVRELDNLARRVEAVERNAAVIRRTQAKVGAPVDREQILAAIHEGRGD